ncbi:hypothetical protein E8E13_005466 [Curvularia kusanoi]|uniref:HMG box domain-containing protein n=1 Tax=Curvularia kusanoi TaxID=90978 RepID=A0A9P4TC34_CURKU|nr:hypothetical protein E8E13_005466 [Curvularia kusanoi]
MLARGALCRWAAEVPKQATHDLPKLASLVQTAGTGVSLPIRTLSRLAQLQVRTYATETVKKAVKAKAAAGESVKKTTTAKKPAAKKATKKAAPKKTKKKAAAPKKKKRTTSRPKKPLTDSEKLNKSIAQLRALALRAPVARRGLSAFNVYVAENVDKNAGSASAAMPSVAAAFKDITPAERERLNHLAAERNEARAAEYKAWVESHTVDEIRIANNARRLLRKKLAERDSLAGKAPTARRPANTDHIPDDRRVKRPLTSFTIFFAERSSSSDFKGIAVTEKAKLIAEEWKALSASEKQRFEDQNAAEKQRYARETSES